MPHESPFARTAGPGGKAEVHTSRAERPREPKPPEELDVLRRAEAALAEALEAARHERAWSEWRFALTFFFRSGGGEIVRIYGPERVVKAMNALDAEGRTNQLDIHDLVVALEPDKAERRKLYDQMVRQAKRLLDAKESRERELNKQTDDERDAADASDLNTFERVWGDIDRSFVLSVELVAAACEARDALGRLAGRLAKAGPQGSVLRAGIKDLAEQLANHPDLGMVLAEAGGVTRAAFNAGTESASFGKRKHTLAKEAETHGIRLRKSITDRLNDEYATATEPVIRRLRAALRPDGSAESGPSAAVATRIAESVEAEFQKFKQDHQIRVEEAVHRENDLIHRAERLLTGK